MIDKDGNYKVPGCPAGPVKITVQPSLSRGRQPTPSGPAGNPPVGSIPARYQDPANTPLDYTVKPGPQKHDIDLTP